MAKVTINDIPPWDGIYELDHSYFNGHELHLIKKVSGVRGGELEDAVKSGDYDVMVAFALIAAKRNGKDIPPDDLLGAPIGNVAFDFTDDVEDDASPPALTQPDDGLPEPSGSDSRTSGDNQENGQSPIGAHGLETSAISDPVTSAT